MTKILGHILLYIFPFLNQSLFLFVSFNSNSVGSISVVVEVVL